MKKKHPRREPMRIVLSPERLQEAIMACGEPLKVIAKNSGEMSQSTLNAAIRDVLAEKPMQTFRATRIARTLGVPIEALGPRVVSGPAKKAQ